MIRRCRAPRVVSAVRYLCAVLAIASIPAVAPRADALPLYASREGRNCISCHVDPNGSAMRNDFGFNYGKNRHSMGEEERWSKVTVNPQLNDWIRLGLDTRIMYVASHEDGRSKLSTSTFFPMEGMLRVSIDPVDYLTIVGAHGLVIQSPGFPDAYVGRELYGLFHGFAKDLYVQVGRFRLPFGLRQDDHTSFTRAGILPYDSQREDAGIEVGAIGNSWFGEASFTNGGDPFNQLSSTFAAKIGRASRAFQFGLSGYDQAHNAAPDDYRWSLYASTTRGQLTVLAEYVADDFKPDDSRKAAFTEAVYRLSRGVFVRAKLDYFGPVSGSPFEEVTRRYLAEVDINPIPFTNIKVSYRRYDYSATKFIATRDGDEYLAMLFIPF